MFKVLLVDDEPFITEGLADAVDWSAFGLEVIGSAEDGEGALELLHEVGADLLITDISMPIMSGLELIRRARLLLPQLKVIILSGFNEFDYLKEGMHLGIENYLLKPIRFAELEATLTDTVRKLNAVQPMPVFGQDELGILRDNVLTRWVNGRIGLTELAERTALLGIDLSKPFAALAVVRALPEVASDLQAEPGAGEASTGEAHAGEARAGEASAGEARASEARTGEPAAGETRAGEPAAGETRAGEPAAGEARAGEPHAGETRAGEPAAGEAHAFDPGADLAAEDGAGVAFVPFCNEEGDWVIACCINDGAADKTRVMGALERLAERWERRRIPLRIAVGTIVPMADAALSYAQARKAQQFFLVHPERRLLDYAGISSSSASLAFPTELLEWERYAKPIMGKDREELLERIRSDFTAIRAADGLNPARAKGAAVELIIWMKMEVDKLGRADVADTFKSLLDQAVAAHVLGEVEEAVKAAALYTADAFSGEDMSPVIKQALRHIHEHYAEALTLKSLGQQFHIHPNYLGQLFHKQTGDMFTDYLNKFRIAKAKELLADSRLKVNEIARQVGYWEIGYFYKQFKKHVGMVPGDYKELL